jgi:hypothetical protein
VAVRKGRWSAEADRDRDAGVTGAEREKIIGVAPAHSALLSGAEISTVTAMSFRRALGLLAAASLLLAGCGAGPTVKPLKTVVVPLELAKTRTIVKAQVGDLLKLELPPVELAGYGWQIFQHDSRFLQQTGDVKPPATADGRPTATFLALKPTPRTTMRFLLVKLDGAKEAQPIDGHDVIFSIE